MSLYIVSKLHKSVLITGGRIDCCISSSRATHAGRWLTALSPGTVALLMAVNGDSICRHDFPQHAFLSVIITCKLLALKLFSILG